jgi:ribonuclease-3
MMKISTETTALQERINYHFKDPSLLQVALTHKSFRNEQTHESTCADNERLEFLGDAVLDLFVGGCLYQIEPQLSEGEMTRVRSELVNEAGLAKVARTLLLGEELLLGRGERRSGGVNKDSLLSNALEAVMGAIFCDGGWPAVEEVATHLFSPLVAAAVEQCDSGVDSKSRLQELLQSRGLQPPEYQLVETEGPDHERSYGIEVLIDDQRVGFGRGRSKKLAQQAAASQALLELTD